MRRDRAPIEVLADHVRSRGVNADPEQLLRMLGRGAVTPLFLFEVTGLEMVQELALRIRNDNWEAWRHETFRSAKKARRLAAHPEADQAGQWMVWARRNGIKFSREMSA